MPNHQRIEMTEARVRRPDGCEKWSRGASFKSVVEPARRRFVKPFSYAFCFFRCLLASITYVEIPNFGQSGRGLPRSQSRQILAPQKHVVQSNAVVARHTSGSDLTPRSLNLHKVRRAAAGFNHSLEPSPTTRVHPPSRLTSQARRCSLLCR